MDNIEKAFGGFFLFVLFVALATLGLIAWGFIELILWLTSK